MQPRHCVRTLRPMGRVCDGLEADADDAVVCEDKVCFTVMDRDSILFSFTRTFRLQKN